MSSTSRAGISGALGMTFVGGSVAVSGMLADAPLHTAQALRYAAACALLVVWTRMTGRTLHRPRSTEWLWLVGVAISGLVVFNVALVHGSRHAEPAVLAVGVACVPVALAAIGPLLEGRSPRARVLAAAVVVSAGAVVVEGFGRADAVGLAWAVTVFVCEAGFTLLAIPVLGRLGAVGVSVHTTWIAAVMFAVLALRIEGISAATTFDAGDFLAIGYLAVGVTALAFILWYSCVHSLGTGRAGLLTGMAPIAAAAIGVPVTGTLPDPAVWAGVALIAAGLGVGLSPEGRSRLGDLFGILAVDRVRRFRPQFDLAARQQFPRGGGGTLGVVDHAAARDECQDRDIERPQLLGGEQCRRRLAQREISGSRSDQSRHRNGIVDLGPAGDPLQHPAPQRLGHGGG
ncbi:DMT family transporter [Mycobacterium sp. NPDC051804]|uniref:DMT family transporter n=1 Tax=Mycobacterium sp. NPDC051804 TaxID=3364295 RepID=UPI00379FB56C